MDHRRVCAFCNAPIEEEGGSVCPECMKKYKLRAYESLDEDGCGCDTK